MKLTFLGAARQVTGSCYLLETSTQKLLIDCGMFQGGKYSEEINFAEWPFQPSEISALLLTHAHLDHCGRIPKLVKDGFKGKIIATGATARLAQLIMEDSAHILEQEAKRHKHDALYTQEEAERVRGKYQEVEYHEKIKLDDNVTLEYFDAGHILGSAMIRITADGKQIVFSGDLGNPPVPILNPTEFIDTADYVVMESTYGGRIHEDRDNRRLLLQSAIYETIVMKGVLMIPAFAMERSQEILYELNEMMNNKDIPPVPIYLDSPLAIKATKIFQEFDQYFNKETADYIKSGDDVFKFPGLKMTLQTEQSKAINRAPAPKIIIAGSGMAQGGRILHHIKRYISFFANQYLVVGYQVEGSLGRRLVDGEKQVRVHHEKLDVKAKVRAIGGYSAHADREKLTAWVSEFDQKKLKKVFITHGEEDQARHLQTHLKQHFEFETEVPEMEQSVEL
ncbi:MBL fold metallo-hydrolase [Patescibacteria group bacterium]